jgi:hypothetical protein
MKSFPFVKSKNTEVSLFNLHFFALFIIFISVLGSRGAIGQHASLSRWKLRVRAPSAPQIKKGRSVGLPFDFLN